MVPSLITACKIAHTKMNIHLEVRETQSNMAFREGHRAVTKI
jgi:hypothetical protein